MLSAICFNLDQSEILSSDNGLSANALNVDKYKILSFCKEHINSLPKDKFLDLSKLKKFADDNFKCNENCRKFSKWVENTVQQAISLFPTALSKHLLCIHEKTRACLEKG